MTEAPTTTGGTTSQSPRFFQSPRPTIPAKLAEAQAAVKPVAKAGHNTQQSYRYATAEDVVRAAQKALAVAGLVCEFSFDVTDETPIQSRSGSAGLIVNVAGELILSDPDSGQTLTRQVIGSGADFPGDKAIYKAMTGARKYALLHLLAIPLGEDPEGDTEGPQKAVEGPQTATTKAQAKAIAAAMKGVPFDRICLLIGSVGGDAPKINRPDSIGKAVLALKADQADALLAQLTGSD